MNTPDPLSSAHRFTHEAMNTTFTLRFTGMDLVTAKGMARECCDLIDFLETRLSLFREGSDVSRINHLKAGEVLYLSESCHQCLLLALEAHSYTRGLFDITLGSHIEHRKTGEAGPVPSLTGKLSVHPDTHAITCEEPGRKIDLGGIGKGFALDQMKQLLSEWGAEGALLAAGASSILAMGPHQWPVDLKGRGNTRHIFLHEQSLSASGTAMQGNHIVHPDGPDGMPATPCEHIWVTAPTATSAEIWSTALMLIAPSEIRSFLTNNMEVDSVHTDHDGILETIIEARTP
jgi:thiamine biosynthesis lipoprotein